MVAFATHSSRQERRAALRRQPTIGTVCRLTGALGQNLGVALVWNLSVSGVSMLLPHRLELGTKLQAELRTAAGTHTLRTDLCVAHVSPLVTGDYVAGCQFAHELSLEDMQPYLGPG